MTRIFDAIRKAGVTRTAAPSAPEPSPDLVRSGHPAPSLTPQVRPSDRVVGVPLAGFPQLSEDELQQMAGLRVSLEAALPDRPARVIAFTSSQSGDGTTTVAHQFGVSLSSDDRQRAVIVDANVRNPSLELDPERRVAWIRARSRRDEGIALRLHGWTIPDAIREAGHFQPGAARTIIEGLAGSYEWVILDLPPVLESPDAASLAAIADGVVLVVQAGRTKRPVITRAVDLLRKSGGRMIGTVLNRRRLEIPEFIYKRI